MFYLNGKFSNNPANNCKTRATFFTKSVFSRFQDCFSSITKKLTRNSSRQLDWCRVECSLIAQGQAQADAIAAVGGRNAVAEGHAAEPLVKVPAAAAIHAVSACGRACGIDLVSTAVTPVPVLTPLMHVPAHVEQHQFVGVARRHCMGAIGSAPLRLMTALWAERKRPIQPTTSSKAADIEKRRMEMQQRAQGIRMKYRPIGHFAG